MELTEILIETITSKVPSLDENSLLIPIVFLFRSEFPVISSCPVAQSRDDILTEVCW